MTNELHKNLIAKSPMGYAYHRIICNQEGVPIDYVFIDVNPAFEAFTGLKSENIIGKRVTEVLPNILEDSFNWIACYGEVAIKGIHKEFEQYALAQNRWFRISAFSFENGYFATAFIDIPEGKEKLEERLEEEKRRYQLAMDGSNDGFWDWNIVTNELYLSPRWKLQLGYQDHEIENDFASFEKLLYEEDKERVMKQVKDYLEGKMMTYDTSFRMLHKDLSLRFVRARGEAIRDEKGKPYRMAGSHSDVTLQVEQHNAILEKENNFHSFFETIDDLLLVGDSLGKILYANQATVTKLGYTYDELYHMHMLELHSLNRRKEAEKIFADMFSGIRDNCPLPLQSKDGKLLPVETRVWFGSWNGETCVFGVVKDLSEREAALDKFHKLFNNNPALMAITNIETKQLVEVNEAFCEKLEYDKSEIIGKTAKELNLFSEPEKQKKVADRLRESGRIKDIELKVRKKSGKMMTGLFAGEVIENQTERSFLTVMTDITEIKKSEKLLKKKDRILSAVAKSTEILLHNIDYMTSIAECFQLLGKATGVDRVHLFQNGVDEDGAEFTSLAIEWCSEQISSRWEQQPMERIPFSVIESFILPLKNNEAYYESLSDFQMDLRSILEKQDILSVLVFPIFVKNMFWGFIEFEDCNNERKWSDIEYSILNAFHSSIERTIERQLIDIELRDAKQKAESANVAKGRFLANMSHEIRTPIHGIMGMLSLLEDSYLNEDQRSYIREAKGASEMLLYLINDILDLSKIEAGKIILEASTFELRSMLEETLSAFLPKAREKNLDLELFVRNSVPEWIVGDELRLRQILNNLISNALKFTREGLVLIEVHREKTLLYDEKKMKLRFVVKDTGIGMSEKVLGQILKPFVQGDASTTREFGGTGLGLVISNELIKLMQGDLFIQSEEGVGSTFEFTVIVDSINPLQVQNKEEKSDQITTPAIEKVAKRAKILLAEDNRINRKVAVLNLEKNGYRCDVAENGEEAYQAWFENRYDIILMDCQMPVIDGYEASKRIREEERGERKTLIIAMTANAMEGDREKCIAAGMDRYYTKPLDFKNIIECIKEVEKSDNSGSVLDEYKNEFIRISGFCQEDVEELFMDFYELLKEHLINLEISIESGDLEQVRKIAHQLKGSAGNLRIEPIRQLAEEMEKQAREGEEKCVKETFRKLNEMDCFQSFHDNY